jgi:exodeoxyribonuclease VII small subunit
MSDEKALDSASFNKNYKILKDTANWLTQQGEPDIDQLVPKVESAMKAYAICKERLDKVQETLGQCLGGDKSPERGEGSSNGKPTRPIPPVDGDDEDDDIPF